MRAEYRYRDWTLRALALAALLALAGTASAQRVEGARVAAEGLYDAEVPVRSQAEGERQSGFARALAQVLGKLSGRDYQRRSPVLYLLNLLIWYRLIYGIHLIIFLPSSFAFLNAFILKNRNDLNLSRNIAKVARASEYAVIACQSVNMEFPFRHAA